MVEKSKYILIISVLLSCVRVGEDTEKIIKEVMKRQESCWNNGDLECFMNGYWESDSLMFIGKENVHFGYQNTLARYQTAYPNKAAMGQLSFTFIYMEPQGKNSFYVIGKYHLKRTVGDLEGHFTLLWKQIDGQWVIVTDHSS